MKKALLALLLAIPAFYAFADEQGDCDAAAGSYISGTVVSGPRFQTGSARQGVKLTHTHIQVVADQDGQTYDVAIDNVYAADFVRNSTRVPNSFKTFAVNTQVSMCGSLYTSGVGIHWVHNNCNVDPSSSTPDGWIKKMYSDGSVSDSYTSSQNYCYLFN